MDQNKIDAFMAANSSRFTSEHQMLIRQKMESMPDEKYGALMAAASNLKNPTVCWVVSFFLGYLGIDRFLVGSVGAGIGKLITFGGFGLWWLIDLFLIANKAREVNYMKIQPYLA